MLEVVHDCQLEDLTGRLNIGINHLVVQDVICKGTICQTRKQCSYLDDGWIMCTQQSTISVHATNYRLFHVHI